MAGVVSRRMRGAGPCAWLVESPSHVGGLAVFEKNKVDGAAGAVRRRAVRRGGEPGVLGAQLVVRKIWPGSTQPTETYLPQPLLHPDRPPRLLDLQPVSARKEPLRANEPVKRAGAELKRVIGQLLHVFPGRIARQRPDGPHVDEGLSVVSDAAGQHPRVVDQCFSVGVGLHGTAFCHMAKAPPRKRTASRKGALTWEPPIGIEPMTYALRVRRSSRLS